MFQINHHWRRAVVKVGSALIAPEGKGCSTRYLLALVDFIHAALGEGREIILVSSGSVAAGLSLVTESMPRPLSIPQKQALAAIGQSKIMQHWQKLFDDTCAQILLTRSDLESPARSNNARNTLNTLLQIKAIPIINENDSVVVDELVVGDNDNLAASVAILSEADLLIICSDVDGLYESDPRQSPEAKRIYRVGSIDNTILACADTTHNPIATGGMHTKLQAAQRASTAGIATLIINGRKGKSFEALKAGQTEGTLFLATNDLIQPSISVAIEGGLS